MKQKLVMIALSIFLLFSLNTESFAKKIEKDADVKKRVVKVEKKEQTAQKTTTTKKENTIKSDTQIKSTPIENINQIQLESRPTTSSSLTGEQINWQVISSGGTSGSSTNFILAGTIGQTAIGMGSSTNYQLNSGFWQTFGPQGCCIGVRGNVNGDPGDNTDVSDLVYLVAFSFQGGDPPPCDEEADVNGSGTIDVSDLVYLVAFSFQGGPPPAACP